MVGFSKYSHIYQTGTITNIYSNLLNEKSTGNVTINTHKGLFRKKNDGEVYEFS